MLNIIQESWLDLRFAARTLSRSRSFTVLAILMLALGIGANTAIFSMVLTVLIRPLPYKDEQRIVWLSNQNNALGIKGAFLNPHDILDFREQGQSFERIAAWGTLPFNLYGGRTPERIEGVFVTPNFFRTVGVNPELGRDFAEQDEPENSVIISHALWLRQFGGDQAVIGKTVSFGFNTAGTDSYFIVGVLPAQANFPVRVDAFTPTEIYRKDFDRGGSHNWRTIARLKPGVTIEQAQAEINTLTLRQAELYPDSNHGWQVQVQPLREYLFGNFQSALLLLFGTVGLVLIIACANIANLQLGRIYSRQREWAVRLALGAGRFRLLRQLLTENLLLSFLGGAIGIFVALACLSFARTLGPGSIPRLGDVSLNMPALIFAVGLSLLTAIAFGILPLLQADVSDMRDALKHQNAGAPSGQSTRLRQALVVGQVALAVILLTGAGLVIKSFWRLQAVDSGINPDHLLTAGLSLSFVDYPNGSPKRTQVFHDALDKLSALPGVTSVGAISHLPLGGRTMQLPFWIVGTPRDAQHEERVCDYRVVTPSFFKTAGIQVKKGRAFDGHDRQGSPQVFLVNEAFARNFLPGRDPIGVRLDGTNDFVKGEIVGVVGSVKHRGLEVDAQPAFYVSYEQSSSFPIMNFVVRTETEPSSLVGPVRRQLESVDQRGVVFNVKTFQELIDEAVAPRRFNLWLFTAFGALAVLLAATGIYATSNFAVVQRTREIGIRMALGAQNSTVMKLILGRSGASIGLGLLIGLALSLVLTRWVKSLLFDVSATDPWTYALMSGLVIGLGFLASWMPARKATRIDPIRTLRCD